MPNAVRMLAAAVALCAAAGAGAHPLDPLSAGEIEAAVAALSAAGDADRETRFASISLDEPEKEAVLAWRANTPEARKAFVVGRRRGVVYEGTVDLSTGRVERWRTAAGVQSAILPSELAKAQHITEADPGWQKAMRRRGYDPAAAHLLCAPMTIGSGAKPGEQGRRLLDVTCFDAAGTNNVWARPIEGLVAVVDLDAEKVIRLTDTGAVPVAREPGRFDAPPPAAAKPQSNPDFTVDGNTVRWKHWSFHYRLDPRAGLVLSLVRFDDRGRERLVLYRGSLAEIFVPYMDPAPAWSFRAYMDEGEYGVGALSLPLAPGIDCPTDAAFLNAVLADEQGRPKERRGVICLFARDTGAPLWRHAETANNTYAGRPATELVIRTIPSLGNYDYVIDWVLTAAGAIRIDVGATGIDQLKGVRTQRMTDPGAASETAYGTLVAPGLVAANHDHFLSFRLDVDIDGARNTLVRRRPVPQSGRGIGRPMWRIVDEPVAVEGPMELNRRSVDELWRIENPNITGALGQHPGYELRLGHQATAARRGGFAAVPLWVTAYDPNELYAAGPYPNQSRGGGALPAYAARHRRVTDADLVLWCTIGFHHIPRPEDWPVLSTMWHGIGLVPDGFFDANPAVDAGTPAPQRD